MNLNLAENLKSLRKERNISQEKLASYLNISIQAVSKWENAITSPDIALLPDIARFYGITVDELLQVEILDEQLLFEEYKQKAYELFRAFRFEEMIPIWQEAYHKMPNNVQVKEMLISAYFDADKTKYQNEIIELGTEIYNSDASTFYKGQAIHHISCTYAKNGNMEMAEQWAKKSYQLIHSQEMIYMQILEDGIELTNQFSFTNFWYFHNLFYMAARLCESKNIPGGASYTQDVFKNIIQIYEIIYPNDDMSFESLRNLYLLHRCVAENETTLGNDENIVKYHLTRAMECAIKSMSIEEHILTHPLVKDWHVDAAPSDNKQVIRLMKEELSWECFANYRNKEWFITIENQLDKLF